MRDPAEISHTNNQETDDTLRALKHDINNQLSNILLALDQLRYEMPNATEDCIFYLDSILMSTTKINAALRETR
jgi:hypothetical protein